MMWIFLSTLFNYSIDNEKLCVMGIRCETFSFFVGHYMEKKRRRGEEIAERCINRCSIIWIER